MNTSKVKNIVIVGGGSAGWMTASYLSKTHPAIDISLIESSDVPVIGVGEATIAHLSRFLHTLELKDSDWMPECNASYKYGIKFENWHEIGDTYWHPFEAIPYYRSSSHLASYWWYQNTKSSDQFSRESMYSDCFLSTDIYKQNRILRLPGAADFADNFVVTVGEDNVPVRVAYAYHFDASMFGQFLKTHVALANGVNHIVDDVVDVAVGDNGNISSITTKSGLKLSGDLFIDCTGFQSLLIGKTLQENYTSFSKTLFCNKAIAMQVPYIDRTKEMNPFTTATALSSGWVWDIPLKNRRGTGYVFCDAFLNTETAEREFRNFLGYDRVESLSSKLIDIKVGKYENLWVNNCIAIGLSSGFIEPLESTGLHFIHVANEKLSASLSGDFYNCGDVLAFNRYMNLTMEEARDMISLHYGLTNREDSSFWREIDVLKASVSKRQEWVHLWEQ